MYPGNIDFPLALIVPNTINTYIRLVKLNATLAIGNQTGPWHKVLSGVNFEKVFKKYLWPKKRQNGSKKTTRKNCRLLQNTVILFVQITKLNVLNS